jgi:predicted ABC-type ATPase
MGLARKIVEYREAVPRQINGLRPPEVAAVKAGRLMLREIDEAARQRESFAFETTLSGLGHLRRIEAWRAANYHVSLLFLSLPTVEMALARVAERVRQGGHNVPEAIVRRRFVSGRRNFETRYRDAVDAWALDDNAREEPVLLEWGEQPP